MTDSIFDIFEDKVDNDIYENGKWFNISTTSKIKLRGIASKKAIEVTKAIDADYVLRLENAVDLTDEELKDKMLRTVAEGCIVDWKGPIFVDDEGKPLKCNAKNALYLISHEKLEKFALFIFNIIRKEQNYNSDAAKANEGN